MAACCRRPRSARKSPRRAACRWAWTAFRRPRTARFRRRSDCSNSSRACARNPAASRPASSSRSAIPGNGSASPRRCSETGILPDFIVVDGGEGGTGAAPLEFTDHVGAPLREALLLVHNTLVGLESARQDPHRRQRQGRHRVRSGAHARARRGLVQCGARLHVRAGLHPVAELPHRPLPDRRRHAGPGRAGRSLNVPDKAERVKMFHENTLQRAQGADRRGGPDPSERTRSRACDPARHRRPKCVRCRRCTSSSSPAS